MTPTDMEKSCNDSLAAAREFDWPEEKAVVTLVTPKGWKAPPKFPRGYLLQVKEDGRRIWHFNSKRVLAWLRTNNMVGAL